LPHILSCSLQFPFPNLPPRTRRYSPPATNFSVSLEKLRCAPTDIVAISPFLSASSSGVDSHLNSQTKRPQQRLLRAPRPTTVGAPTARLRPHRRFQPSPSLAQARTGTARIERGECKVHPSRSPARTVQKQKSDRQEEAEIRTSSTAPRNASRQIELDRISLDRTSPFEIDRFNLKVTATLPT